MKVRRLSKLLPWELGAIARAAGLPPTKNPYSPGSIAHNAWKRGYEWEDGEIGAGR